MKIHEIYFHDLKLEVKHTLAMEHGYDSAEEYIADTNADIAPIAELIMYNKGEEPDGEEPDEDESEDENEFDDARSYGPHGFVPKRSHDEAIAPSTAAPDFEAPWNVEDIGGRGDIHFEIRDVQGDLVAELNFDREPYWDDETVVLQEQVYRRAADLIATAPDMHREITEEIERMGVWIKALATDRDAIEDVVQGMEISRDKFERLLLQAKGETE